MLVFYLLDKADVFNVKAEKRNTTILNVNPLPVIELVNITDKSVGKKVLSISSNEFNDNEK